MLVNLNDILEYAGMAMEAAVIGLLFYRRAWRTLPIFCVYTVWTLLSDGVDYFISHQFNSLYLSTYFVGQFIDYILQFCVLVEVAWSVVRPFRASLPRRTGLFLGLLIAAVGGVIWVFANSPTLAHIPYLEWRLLLRLKTTFTVLRIILFLLLAFGSRFLSIGWRDRELQVMTGLGFYSLAALTVIILQSHQGFGTHYRNLDQLLVATYLGSLLYWIFSFAQKEAERRQFSPQMQGMLLAVAGAARGTRIALTSSDPGKSHKNG